MRKSRDVESFVRPELVAVNVLANKRICCWPVGNFSNLAPVKPSAKFGLNTNGGVDVNSVQVVSGGDKRRGVEGMERSERVSSTPEANCLVGWRNLRQQADQRVAQIAWNFQPGLERIVRRLVKLKPTRTRRDVE